MIGRSKKSVQTTLQLVFFLLVTLVFLVYISYFIVSESRKIPVERIRQSEIGDGRIFSGEQALKLGLIDSFGYFRDAVDAALFESVLIDLEREGFFHREGDLLVP